MLSFDIHSLCIALLFGLDPPTEFAVSTITLNNLCTNGIRYGYVNDLLGSRPPESVWVLDKRLFAEHGQLLFCWSILLVEKMGKVLTVHPSSNGKISLWSKTNHFNIKINKNINFEITFKCVHRLIKQWFLCTPFFILITFMTHLFFVHLKANQTFHLAGDST